MGLNEDSAGLQLNVTCYLRAGEQTKVESSTFYCLPASLARCEPLCPLPAPSAPVIYARGGLFPIVARKFPRVRGRGGGGDVTATRACRHGDPRRPYYRLRGCAPRFGRQRNRCGPRLDMPLEWEARCEAAVCHPGLGRGGGVEGEVFPLQTIIPHCGRK